MPHGLRVIDITISLCSIAWIGIRQGLTVWGTRLQAAPISRHLLSGDELATIRMAPVMLLMWVFFFNEQTVRGVVFTNAPSLILTCEKLERRPTQTMIGGCDL